MKNERSNNRSWDEEINVEVVGEGYDHTFKVPPGKVLRTSYIIDDEGNKLLRIQEVDDPNPEWLQPSGRVLN